MQTRATAAPAAAALTATLGLAAVAWAIAVRQMSGMDMGPAAGLGSVGFFAALWVPMMAAMMLPGAAPAAVRVAQDSGGIRAVPLFLGSYLAVWALVGVAVYGCTGRTDAVATCHNRGGPRAHPGQGVPAARPGQRPAGLAVGLAARLDRRADADPDRAERDERRLDGRARRARSHPEAVSPRPAIDIPWRRSSRSAS
jgi:hypothetical protein